VVDLCLFNERVRALSSKVTICLSTSFGSGRLLFEINQQKWSPAKQCLKPLWGLKFSIKIYFKTDMLLRK
jgi:hypothetical protein